jgi:hypothetical protein
MKRVLLVTAALAIVGACLWAWTRWASSPEQKIRRQLDELAAVVSFDSSDGLIAAAFDLDSLTGFFTEDVEVRVVLEGRQSLTVQGRTPVLERAKAARALLDGLNVEFLDTVVSLAPDGNSAEVATTGSADAPESRERWIQELRFLFVRTEDGWKIARVETVRMLSGGFSRPDVPRPSRVPL